MKRVNLPRFTRDAFIQPATLNEMDRTVDVVFSTGARVTRGGFFSEPYHEELSLEQGHVRLERLNNGAPFLHNHRSETLDDVLGVVESASVDGKQGLARIRFSERDSVKPVLKDIKDGIIRNISVGYAVHKFEEQKDRAADGMKVYLATDWEPIEVSAVPAGADDGAKFRSDEKQEQVSCEVVEVAPVESVEVAPSESAVVESANTEEINRLATEQLLRKDTHTGEKQMTEQEMKLAADAAQAEKLRQKEIRSAVKAAKLDVSFAEELIDGDKSIDESRKVILEQLAIDDKKIETRSAGVTVTRDEGDTMKEGMTEAILHRFRAKSEVSDKVEMPGYALTEKGRPFMYRSLLDMARMRLESRGINTSQFSKSTLAERALNSTSDFPEILANVANKTLRDGYLRAPATWQPFTREVTAPDFKQISRTNLGDGESLELVGENSEVKHGSMSENAEKYQIYTYAKIIAMSRQMLVNDDLSAFTRVPEKMGRRARDLESDKIWSLIASNPLMSDGIAVFAAGHGNLGTGAAPSEAGLNQGRKSMRLQVGLDGEVISIVPQWFYVAPSDETAAEKLVASIVPDSSANVSPFSSAGRTPLKLAVEPRIEPSSGSRPWYLCASMSQIDMVELARLEGQEGPALETRAGFDVEGMEIKVRHDIGVAVIDFRGLFKNPGA